jgi:hypothetical protein
MDEHNNPKEGDYLAENNSILRFKNGYLHGENEPAVVCDDGHIEFWNNGKLHRGKGDPAIISQSGDITEFWTNGKRQQTHR